MSPKKRKRDCWGFLIPIRGRLPVIPLEYDEITIGSDPECDIQGEQLGCDDKILFKRHFQVINSKSGPVIKNISSKQVYINGLSIRCGEEVKLVHNATIAITSTTNRVVTYADKVTSDSSEFNEEITKKYVVSRSLGSGGYGQVFLAIDKKKHEQFAVKVTGQGTYAKREAEILRRLDHPCIIHIHNVIINPTRMYLVMDYMRGGDLSQWVNSRKLLTENQMKLIFYQIALAVGHLHDKCIGHRDLKPCNILLKSDEPKTLIKVTDFGLAKDEHIHSAMNTKAGSEPYIAPEVMDSKTYTKEVDIWSMGVILFFSLSGALPFKDVAEAKMKNYMIMYIPKNWTGVSLAAVNLVKKMLDINPKKRVKIHDILKDAWLQDEDIISEVNSLMGIPEKTKKRKTSVPSTSSQSSHVEHRKLSVPVGSSRENIPPRGALQFMKPHQDLHEEHKKDSLFKRIFTRASKKK